MCRGTSKAQNEPAVAERIFLLLPEKMLLNGRADAILKGFIDYIRRLAAHTNMDGMIIYTR